MEKLKLSPDEMLAITAELESGVPLPPSLVAKQVTLNADRVAFKSWVDENKNPDARAADGTPAPAYKFTREEFEKRSNELGAKTNEFLTECEPAIEAHRLTQLLNIKTIGAGAARRIAREGGSLPDWAFGDATGGMGKDASSFKSLYEAMAESNELKSVIESLPSNASDAVGRFFPKVSIKGINMPAQMSSENAMKTAFTTAAGFPLPTNRSAVVVDFAHQRPTVADFIPQRQYDQQIFQYLELTTWTNNAAPVAESATKPESALAYTARNIYLEVIGHTLPLTEQVRWFADSVIQQALQGNLVQMLKLAEEQQLLNGTGTRPQLTGITTRSGIQTYARSTTGTIDNNMDAIYQAQQLVRFIGFAEPTVTFINPANMTAIMLSKDSQGRYLFGNPHEAGPSSLWGLPIVQTTGATAGTAVTGDFATYDLILRHLDVMVQFGYVSNQFAQNALTMRVEELVGQAVLRPAAFATATGLI